MRPPIVLLPFLFLFTLAAAARPAQAWVPDGSLVCSEDSTRPMVVPDGVGGTILVWQDGRGPGVGWDLYAQRVDATGVPQWAANGVAVCIASNYQYNPTPVPDGSGGVIVAWYDFRSGSYDVYAQRVDGSGTPLWTVDGVPVCTAANTQSDAKLVSDGAGGAIITWRDNRSGNDDIYAQRVDGTGARKWTANGVPVCTAAFSQTQQEIVSDGANGAIIAWQDLRNGATEHIYAQRIDATGGPVWLADGVALCLAANYQLSPVIVPDGAGGAVVAWEDYRSGVNYDVYAQRVNGTGSVKWAADGEALCTAANSQSDMGIAPDGNGGAVVAWRDYRSGSNYDVYAQHVDGFGNTIWAYDGLGVCTISGNQLFPRVIQDAAGDFVFDWNDYRNAQSDVYVQKVTSAGVAQWTSGGTPVCTDPANQANLTLVWDEGGGTVITWEDYRTGYSQVYAQRVEITYGYWGHPEPIVDAVADIPNDQGGKVAVDWTASGRDLPTPRAISQYSIWRAVDMIPAAGAGGATVLTDLGNLRAGTTGPVYASLATVPGYYWELVGTQDAHGWPGYSFSTDTRADSVSGNTGTEVFMVAAHYQYDDYVAFASNAVSGHSVDNLAPAAPLMLTAQRVGSDVNLAWNPVTAADLGDYAIYRALAPGVAPEPVNFLSASPDTHWVDTGVPTSALYYIVTAKDVHENQSDPSNEVVVGTETGVGGTLPVTALRVLANRPNPFAASTLFRVGLPADAPVRVEVFDVAGRRVRLQNLAGNAGWQDLAFDGRDDAGRLLPGGTYFYRVSAAGKTVTRKILIAR